MLRGSLAAALHLALLSGCVLDDVPLDDLACPCAEGWRCNPATDRCMRGDGGDVGMDGGADSGVEADAGGDGGALDAGAIDAGMDGAIDGGPPVDASTDGGTAADAGSDAGGALDDTICDELSPTPIFCDGFESGLTPWVTREVDGTTTISSATPYRGTAALLAETTAASGKASVNRDFSSAITSGNLYARAYFYVPSFATSGVSVLFLGENAPPYLGIAVQLGSDATGEVYVGTEGALATGGTSTAFPRDRWACVTLELVVGTSGSVRATVDGTVIADQSSIDTLPAAGMGKVIAGIEFTPAAQTSAEVHMDEVVVSTSPIPCD